MPKRKINKKDAVTFQLVHRSQQDPLIADEDAPQRVLLPVTNDLKGTSLLTNNDLSEDDQSTSNDTHSKQVKFKLDLPAEVFPSEVEEKVGMLGKAAPISGPQLHLDPDIIAAMDEDFDFSDPENELEDNFIELANGGPVDDNEMCSGSDFDEEEDDFEVSDEEYDGTEWKDEFEKEETKSRFTNYSITSSVIRRNENLRLLDEKFEKMFINYEENEIGALDLEDIEGDVSSNVLLDSALEEFNKAQKNLEIDKTNVNNIIDESSDEEEVEDILVENSKRKWDCESILSTYSNIYNHPKKIKEPKNDKIQINKKTGIPSNVFHKNGLTVKTLDKLNRENEKCSEIELKSIPDHTSQLSILSQRPKGETPEERRLRKQKLKEYRKERRLEKKINSEAFKEEAKRQVKININNKNNVQGNKIL